MKQLWITAAVAVSLCGCARHAEGGAAACPSVYVVSPAEEDNASTRTFAGIVEEASEVSIGFKTAGQLDHIYAREGQHVAKGQLIASLDDADYRLGVEALQIQYDQLSDEVARAKKLFEKKSMTANDYEKASAGLRQLGVQLQVNKNKLDYTKLYSPVSGIVESVNFSVGEMVDAGTAVFTLLDVSDKSVVVDIPASVYARRDEIGQITCRPTGGRQAEYAMRVLSIVPKADSNQLYRMKLAFATADASATPGMNMEAVIRFDGDGQPRMRLPQSALFLHDGKECVWVVAPDSTVAMRQVEIDPRSAGETVDVTAGLGADERVVRAGVRRLHQGEKVKIIGAPSATNAGGML